MRVLLLVSAFNGLSQRVWCALREAGHDVGVLFATGPQDIVDGVQAAQPELIICPYLRDRVPTAVWQHHRTVIIHPGPVGDRGPSSLDWAIADGAPAWGVTALQAVEEMDAGPVWASRTFPMPLAAPRKSSLYNGPVADAAVECVLEVIAKAADPAFRPTPAAELTVEVQGARSRPAMQQADRAFDWTQPTEHIIRRIRAADGAPGVRTTLAGLEVFAYDAHPGLARGARPGALLGRRQGAVLVGTGDGSVWLGHLHDAAQSRKIKLPATTLLGKRLRGVADSPLPPGTEPEGPSYRQVRYRRSGPVGWLAFDFYNGAMSTGHCRRLLAALRHAAAQDTRVLVLRGGTDTFSNGIHLNVIDAAGDPAAAAWANIKAMNEVCREIITCTRQVVIAAYAGSAGAGGVMLGLGADIVAARQGVILNPYYDMGLYGSELHTFTLPRRVGPDTAQALIDAKLPISAERAGALGLVDEVGPRHPEAYGEWLTALAVRQADARDARRRQAAKAKRLAGERVPLDVYEARELAEMSSDMFGDRSGFTAARRAFVGKVRPADTPARLLLTQHAEHYAARPRQLSRPIAAPAVEAEVHVRSAVPMSA
ncbi:hydrogenase maturation protein [Amorphoplanes digitatis]|uniref:Putative two-component system hydrogenase maturation factor HypX/HoxX n=1 Tax=Actinoplanes digitatis TaxID=1868 RepID=A0A7W7I4Q4_9ACTN|nr:hydrogenase maturation protein [Actinoplanes digitatis]MBB4766410.1 putative two-component system hydrogenase maturation factor HypX/HoxX [Actinoplanes digitatis]GID96114.1 formyl transferase [Actinoplanes digitatis]